MVECEFKSYLFRGGLDYVLIDTWWNVNSVDLILQSLLTNGFNRYMVECELLSEFVDFYGNYSF